MDPASLARYEGYLAEVDETVLAGETLPTLTGNPSRINASCRATCTVASRTVRICAIPRSRYPQGSGYRVLLGCVRQVRLISGGGSAWRRCRSTRAIGGSALVVDHLCPCVLETRAIRFNDIPTEQREDFVEARVAGQVGVVEVGVAAVAEPDVGRNQGKARLYRVAGHRVNVLNTIVVEVDEGLGVDIRLPLVHGNLTHIDRCSAVEPDGR